MNDKKENLIIPIMLIFPSESMASDYVKEKIHPTITPPPMISNDGKCEKCGKNKYALFLINADA